jgi:ribosome-associated heat shock protein Hsp15
MSEDRLRIDKWLWYGRFFKSRSFATRLCAKGRVRLNSAIVSKAHATVKTGDVLTFPQGSRIRVVKVAALGARRGPAAEAQTLYDEIAPPSPREERSVPATGARARGSGRPTKAARRAIGRLKGDR